MKETASAARAYFDKVNAQGGVNGRKIVLESMDDGFDTKRSVENAKKLIDEKNVLALFLFRGTANAEAVMPVIAEKKTPMFAGVGSSIKMHEPHEPLPLQPARAGADRGDERRHAARLAGHHRCRR